MINQCLHLSTVKFLWQSDSTTSSCYSSSLGVSSEQERMSSGWSAVASRTSMSIQKPCDSLSSSILRRITFKDKQFYVLNGNAHKFNLGSLVLNIALTVSEYNFYMNMNEWCFLIFWRGSRGSLANKKLNCIWWFIHKPHVIAFPGLNINLLENGLGNNCFLCLSS